MDVDHGVESEALTSLGETYSHNLEVVEKVRDFGIRCRILCAQTRRRVASCRRGKSWDEEENVSFLLRTLSEPNRGCQNQSLKRRWAPCAIGSVTVGYGAKIALSRTPPLNCSTTSYLDLCRAQAKHALRFLNFPPCFCKSKVSILNVLKKYKAFFGSQRLLTFLRNG
jgi:hypothetical protein